MEGTCRLRLLALQALPLLLAHQHFHSCKDQHNGVIASGMITRRFLALFVIATSGLTECLLAPLRCRPPSLHPDQSDLSPAAGPAQQHSNPCTKPMKVYLVLLIDHQLSAIVNFLLPGASH